MKKNNITLMILLLLFFKNFTYAQSVQQPNLQQSNQTFFIPTAEMLDLSKFTNVNQSIALNNDRFVLNIQFHGVLETNGSSYSALGEAQAFYILARLNEAFNVHNIFFKYRGFNTIKNSNLNCGNFSGNFSDYTNVIKQQFINEDKYDENSLNFFLYQCSSGDTSGINPNNNTDIYLGNYATNLGGGYYYQNIIPKLLGHSLGLLNIESAIVADTPLSTQPPCFLNGIISYQLLQPTFNSYNPDIENVARSGPNFNATIAGDRLADTQACYINFQQNFCANSTNGFPNLVTWNFDANNVDYVGNPYVCTINEGNNFMTLYGGPGSNGLFTAGQANRMKEFIEGNLNTIYRIKLNLNEDDTPDVSVLYEPFYINGGSVGNENTSTSYSKTFSTNSTNTGANVWNCGPFAMRFQTGFNCEFSAPSGVINQSIYQQYNTSTSSYVGIKIPILGQQIYTNSAPVCFGTFEPFTSGDVKSLSNLGSGVYTQEQLDEIKASDPRLYEELQSGKYHIITKETNSGYKDQKVIYKN